MKATRARGDKTGYVHFACVVIAAFRKYCNFVTNIRVKHSVSPIREANRFSGRGYQLRRAAITLCDTLYQKGHAILVNSSLINTPEKRLGRANELIEGIKLGVISFFACSTPGLHF